MASATDDHSPGREHRSRVRPHCERPGKRSKAGETAVPVKDGLGGDNGACAVWKDTVTHTAKAGNGSVRRTTVSKYPLRNKGGGERKGALGGRWG